MSAQAVNYQFGPSRPLVDPGTGLLVRDGIDLLKALIDRTGKGTGIIPVVSGALTATGATINDALQLMADWNLVGTVPAGSGAQILSLKPGQDIQVLNLGANALKVYPPSATAKIDALGLGAPFVLAAGKLRIIECWTLSQYASFGN